MRPLSFLKPYAKAPFPQRYTFMEPILQPIVRERFSPEETRALDGLVSAMKLASALMASGVDPDERLLVALTREFDARKFEPWCDRVASGKKPRAVKPKPGAPDVPLLMCLSHAALSAAAAVAGQICDELDADWDDPEVERDDARDRDRVRLAHAISVFCATVDASLDTPNKYEYEYEWRTLSFLSKRHELTWPVEDRHPHHAAYVAERQRKRKRLDEVERAAKRVLAQTYIPKPPPLCPTVEGAGSARASA